MECYLENGDIESAKEEVNSDSLTSLLGVFTYAGVLISSVYLK